MFLVQKGLSSSDSLPIPVTVVEASQPSRLTTNLTYVQIDETGERLLVPDDGLIDVYFEVGSEVVATIHYQRPQTSVGYGGGMGTRFVEWGDLPKKAVIRSSPAYDPTSDRKGWYQVAEVEEDGTLHIVKVSSIRAR